MRVLVTGGGGFIGSHLIPRLVELDHDIYCLERYVTGRFVLGADRAVKTVFCDLRDNFAVRKTVREVQPEVVIHLASLSPVAYSYDHPVEVIDTNFMATVYLAEACLREVPHFRHFLFAGTSEEYGNHEKMPITENYELRPNSPYAVSKVASDQYLQYMRDAYHFPVTILRNFNTYGRRDNTHFVVERAIEQMLKDKTVRLGDPKPVRDFLYIDDHVSSYLTCLNNEKAIGQVFNFCTGHGVTIAQLIDILMELTGTKSDVLWNTIPERPLDIAGLVGDNSKAKRVLEWQPRTPLKEGLKITVNYWKNKLQKR